MRQQGFNRGAHILRRESGGIVPSNNNGIETFNLVAALPGRASSIHTQRAYYRWLDTYLVDLAGLKPTYTDERIMRMSALSVALLQQIMSAAQLRAWLGKLAMEGHGRQGVQQARAALVTIASVLAEAGLLDDYTSAGMSNVRAPNAEDGQRPGRWLSPDELKVMMAAARHIATTDNQELRNALVMTMLCTLALRRDELSSARWGDLSIQNNRAVLMVHGKGKKTAMVDLPRPVVGLLTSWRGAIQRSRGTAASLDSPLVRRLWKGGRVSRFGLTADGIWEIVGQSAVMAGIGHVAPHDLRRSVAGALHEAGTPIDKISQLLRHANVAVTERYLSRLPRVNEGGVIMSGLLGFEDDDESDEVYG
ncbi:MAG: tyrosine-type recombinase/integrase [Burkholderiales bacterium]|nr:tyrosine-type recombinase/integrase [Anaerolineae bacterium]